MSPDPDQKKAGTPFSGGRERGTPDLASIATDIAMPKTAHVSDELSDLTAQPEFFKVTLASIGDAVISTDRRGCINFLNPVAENLTGWKIGDAVGQPVETVFAIINEYTREKAPNPIRKALAEGVTVALANHTALLSRDGQERSIEDSAAPIRDQNGEIIGAVMVFHDVTERRQAVAELAEVARLNSLRADIGDAIIGGQTLPVVLQKCSVALVKHLDAAFARIWTLNDADNVLELQASAGLYTHLNGAHGRVKVGEFKIGRIARDRKPLLTNHVLTDPNISDPAWAKKEGMVSFAGYPLIVQGRLMGVMAIFGRKEFSERVLHELSLAADAISQWVLRRATENALRAYEAGQQVLLKLLQDQRELREPPAMMRAAAEAAGRWLGVDRVGFMEVLDENIHFTAGWIGGTLPILTDTYPTAGIEGGLLTQIRAGKTIAISDTGIIQTEKDSAFSDCSTGSLIIVPILKAGKWVGGLYMNHSVPRHFGDAEITLVRDIAEQTWDSVERARAVIELDETKARLETTLRASEIGTWNWDVQQDKVFADANLARLFNVSEKEAAGGPIETYVRAVHPDDKAALEKAIAEAMASEKGLFEVDYRLIQGDGSIKSVVARGRVEKDGEGKPCRFPGVVIDITDRKKAEKALAESEKRFRAIVTQATTGIVQADAQGRMTFVNQRWCEMVGYQEEELLGRSILDVTAPDFVEPTLNAVKKLVAGGGSFQIEKRYQKKDGAVWWAVSNVNDIRGRNGEYEGLVAIVFDDSERKAVEDALRESEDRFRALADNMSQLAWMAEANGARFWHNRRWLEYTGVAPEEMNGWAWEKITDPEALEDVRENWKLHLQSGEEWEDTFPIKGAEGQYRWFLTRAVPIHDAHGKVVRWFGTCTDINDRKVAHEENLRMMERERAARIASESAGQMKDDFLATLSHELRTPLNPVLLLASEGAENLELAASTRADFAVIAKNVALEARLIDDLLDLTKITRGKLALSVGPINIHAVIADAIETVAADVTENEIKLVTDLSASMAETVGDPVRLQQVFWNILRNAVKFTPKGGSVTVATGLSPDHKRIEVRITDTGMGMTPEEVNRLFNAFVQGDHAGKGGSHQFGGLGLGLAISRMLVELHSGRIWATSSGIGHGSTFSVEIPIVTSADEGKTQHPSPQIPKPLVHANARATRILLVEDHEPTRLSIAQLLRRRHYEVVAVGSVTTALVAAKEYTFDILITDIGLPDGDGYQLMKIIRQTYGMKGIALTGYGMEEDLAKSKLAGFATHLTKPIRIQALDAALAAVAAVVPQP